MAKVAYGLYKGGFLNAVSVGFIPVRWENGSEEKGYRRKYLEQELLEVSAVSIPANPNALTLGLKSGAIEMSDLRELAELLQSLCDSPAIESIQNLAISPAERIPDTSALGSAIDEARLLHLTKQMNEIRAVLRRA